MENNILIWLSGADPEALSHCTKAERRKYIKLGLTVIIPAIMGWVGMWFASPYIGVDASLRGITATVWSIVVLLIDTYLVSSLNKGFSNDNKLRYLALAFVRIMLGVFIGVVISHPIVLRILEKNIDEELSTIKREKIYKIISANRDSADEWSKKIQLSILKNDSNILCQERLLMAEGNGEKITLPCGSSSGNTNKGFRYIRLDSTIRELKSRRKRLEDSTLHIQNQFNNKSKLDTATFSKNYSSDYLKRMYALDRLKKSADTLQPTKLMTIFLLIFFVLLDSIAIISKVISPSGLYEIIYDAVVKEKANTAIEIYKMREKLGLQVNEKDATYRAGLIEKIYNKPNDFTPQQLKEASDRIVEKFGIFIGSNKTTDSSNGKFKMARTLGYIITSMVCGCLIWHFMKTNQFANDEIAIFITIYTTAVSVASPVLLKA